MEKEKAIEIFNKWMDCKDAYQADPSCDGNCFSCEYYASAEEEKEAMLLAISALEKQEKDRWIPVIRCEDCKYYGSRRWCELHSSVFDDNAFCSYGEREERSEQDGSVL